jgi:anti-sigma factor (TIGR02949 family)
VNCPEIARLLDAYADGELDAHSAHAVEAHLSGCARCRASLQSVQALRAALLRAGADDAAPSALRERIRQRLSTAPPLGHAADRRGWLLAAPGVAALALAGYLALARPWLTAPQPAAGEQRVVYHIAGGNVSATLRTLKNHLDATPNLKVVVVAHNDGIEFLLAGARDETGTEYARPVRELRRRGVEFRVCSNTLTRRNIDARAVIPDAVLVPSGIAEIGRLQSQEGYTYLRL